MSSFKVAFQGEPGAYGEGAATAVFGQDVQTVPCLTFDKVFDAVETGLADRAVLPIENSLAGTIHHNYDLLLNRNLHIVGEHDFPVHHFLLALPGVKLEDVKRVLSHPMALAQCDDFLTRHGAVREATYDTAGSAKRLVEENLRDAAAIASSRAGKIYNLNVLASNIEDDQKNFTRFLVLSREPEAPPPGLPCKTSIVFSLPNAPGALFKALSVFALRDIDLHKIESRPWKAHSPPHNQAQAPPTPSSASHSTQSEPGSESEPAGGPSAGAAASVSPVPAAGPALGAKRWEYLFYLDFGASSFEEVGKHAHRHLAEIAPFMRVLGSYPRHVAE